VPELQHAGGVPVSWYWLKAAFPSSFSRSNSTRVVRPADALQVLPMVTPAPPALTPRLPELLEKTSTTTTPPFRFSMVTLLAWAPPAVPPTLKPIWPTLTPAPPEKTPVSLIFSPSFMPSAWSGLRGSSSLPSSSRAPCS
jgi:hypothetical protein